MDAGALVKPERLTGWPSQLRRMLGTQAAFLTSGLVHESFLWYALTSVSEGSFRIAAWDTEPACFAVRILLAWGSSSDYGAW